MTSFSDKNILIGINLKKERVLFFNYFDELECAMIYTSKDLRDVYENLTTEKIDILIIEFGSEFVRNVSDIQKLKAINPEIKIIMVITQNQEINKKTYQEINNNSDVLLFEPLSKLEINTKLITITENNVVEKSKTKNVADVKPVTNNDLFTDNELWEIFFIDSQQGKIIVNAKTHKIMYANNSFLDLLDIKTKDIIGKTWKVIDDQKNHIKYNTYIKDINTKDSTQFIIEFCNHFNKSNKTTMFNVDYRMSVLDGEVVYSGIISIDQSQDFSTQLFDLYKRIISNDISKGKLPDLLDTICKTLNLKFMMFFEYQNNHLMNLISGGEITLMDSFYSNSKTIILEMLQKNEIFEIDRNSKNSEYKNILNSNNIESFCLYPIGQQNKTYGCLLAIGKSTINNWRTISIVLNSLAMQCRFFLFQKLVAKQREKEGKQDNLTGLPNRSSMTGKFAELVEAGISDDKYISLMIIDFDNLNYFNKNIGIELTNELIINLSQIIVASIRNKGQVYRLSADEFMVLLHPNINKKLAESSVKELIKKMNKPILLSNGEDVKINFNIGISIFPDDGQTVSSMMKNADLAMYDAKLAGKNNYIIFKHSETGQALKQKTEMEDNLKKAITDGHIKAYYQPKINALTEDVIGFEALVRWVDPVLGMINPGHFIPLAEETGLINEIGEIVTTQSCEMLVDWHKKFGLALSCSINLSAVQLMDQQLPKKLEKIINSSGVHPHYIDFEITETISLDVVPNLVESLNEIVEIGCTLSIDDFGTGHSSLDYVKKIPAKYIKIDQSFVKNIGLNPEDEAILDATINIAKRLNREIIAEGVETEEQREYLLDRECEYFQGYLFARPMPAEGIENILKQRVTLMGTQ